MHIHMWHESYSWLCLFLCKRALFSRQKNRVLVSCVTNELMLVSYSTASMLIWDILYICVTLSPAQSEWAPRRMHLCWVTWHHSARPRLLSGKRQICSCQFGKLNILVKNYILVKRDLCSRPQRPIFSAKVPYISGKRVLYSRPKGYILFGKIHVLEKTIRCAHHDWRAHLMVSHGCV